MNLLEAAEYVLAGPPEWREGARQWCKVCGHEHEYRRDPEDKQKYKHARLRTWRFCVEGCPPHIMEADHLAPLRQAVEAEKRNSREENDG